ncbi:hypothetical protein [Paralcaligenes ureilyticus]|uniref:Uncharacterized protein n=1 Tax=Paralcaligenes ureilyticus TaxID=627131 RepID=A0A4R3MB36_9BURK|nr:hypothetical protein [Paralcaligenes ureilyticus]TCT10352.1 hypothetical protein EDC26_102309 [Paralcaligenes ureilyticus]
MAEIILCGVSRGGLEFQRFASRKGCHYINDSQAFVAAALVAAIRVINGSQAFVAAPLVGAIHALQPAHPRLAQFLL